MNKQLIFSLTTIVALLLVTPMASAHPAYATIWSADHQGITLDGGDAVIHGDDGTEARITPGGALFIADKPQKVTPAQQQQLMRYVSTVQDMQAKGLVLAGEAGQFAESIVSEVVGGLFSDESQDQIEQKANQRAHNFKQQALPICRDAQTLKQLQDTLVSGLPAFQPYAIIEGHDVNDCQRDITSDN